mmetsp:Transcript_26788/g.64775  ORF Transcript_26788/g.64775 Transcript_26788/m.64775 type:complete len:154 (-) Transcript_26788:115-576(-)
MNLRTHPSSEFENVVWRRYFTRSQASFDKTREHCTITRSDPESMFAKTGITPQNQEPDVSNSALPIATLRAGSEYECKRASGCEGTMAGQWRQLYHPGKTREMLKWETTLRGMADNRSDDCLTEMRGKKKWQGEQTDNFALNDVPASVRDRQQ